MKKTIFLLLLVFLFTGLLGAAPAFAEDNPPRGPVPPADDSELPPLRPFMKENIDVVAIFAAPCTQPYGPDGQDKADTIWIYYSDNTFDQYAETGEKFDLFSKGTYAFKDGGDFIIGEDEDNGIIVINRTHKLSPEGLTEHESSHEYELGTLGFEQLFGPEDAGKQIVAIFGDTRFERYTDDDGITRFLDTVWLFFADNTFRQYVFLNGDVVLFSSGAYEFDEFGDFHFPLQDDNHGTITLTWEYSEEDDAQLSCTYDLNTLLENWLFEYFPERPSDMAPPLQ